MSTTDPSCTLLSTSGAKRAGRRFGSRLPSLPMLGTLAVAGAAYFGTPALASAATVKTCVRWQAQTNDSNVGEDRLAWANNAGAVVTGYGAYLRITEEGTANHTYVFASPTNGCATWEGSTSKEYTVRVYYMVKDSNGNIIRSYWNSGDDGTNGGSYPGSTRSVDVTNYTPTVAGNNIDVGYWNGYGTTMATASMMTRYFGGYTTDEQIHIGNNLAACGNSSAHHCLNNCVFPTDAYVRLDTSACADDHRRSKFLVAHEVGHAKMILQQNQIEWTVDWSETGAPPCDSSDQGYTPTSYENNGVSMREGFAHFAALWTFNDPTENDAWIKWLGVVIDAESNNPALEGGFLGNNCNMLEDGYGTNVDAMRLYWDWTTPSIAPNKATRQQVMQIYENMVHTWPNKNQYWIRFYGQAYLLLGSNLAASLLGYSCFNGLRDENC